VPDDDFPYPYDLNEFDDDEDIDELIRSLNRDHDPA
jgi:hypothetical protein